MGRLDISFLVLAALFLGITIIALPTALKGGAVSTFSTVFYLFMASLAVQGLLVLRSVCRNSRTRPLTILKWLVGCVSIFTVAVFLLIRSSAGTITILGAVDHSAISDPLLFLLLWSLFFSIACLWMSAIAGAIWVLSRFLMWFLPLFLQDLKGLRYDGSDPWYGRVYAWAFSVPYVLEPSSLQLEVSPLDALGARGRFFHALRWQVALGLLISVYVSLNPMLLSTMSFAETYALVSVPVGLIPLLVLPWSVMEVLGVKMKGPRRDFYLHEGAKKRMTQTLVALGTLVLIVRFAVDRIGMELLAFTFASYLVTLLILSVMVSFVYFNFFERDLINDIADALGEIRL